MWNITWGLIYADYYMQIVICKLFLLFLAYTHRSFISIIVTRVYLLFNSVRSSGLVRKQVVEKEIKERLTHIKRLQYFLVDFMLAYFSFLNLLFIPPFNHLSFHQLVYYIYPHQDQLVNQSIIRSLYLVLSSLLLGDCCLSHNSIIINSLHLY